LNSLRAAYPVNKLLNVCLGHRPCGSGVDLVAGEDLNPATSGL
jgi:hypothetical protein